MVARERELTEQLEWFNNLVSYLKVRTLALYLKANPEMAYEGFELLWPTLFDNMLHRATRETCWILKQKVEANNN
jgi:hypothetical protein